MSLNVVTYFVWLVSKWLWSGIKKPNGRTTYAVRLVAHGYLTDNTIKFIFEQESLPNLYLLIQTVP